MEKKENLKCPECKKTISNDDVFCTNCGYRLKEDVKKDTLNNVTNFVKKNYCIEYVIILVGIILFIKGLTIDIPSRTFSFYTLKEYVGGDAYNAIIESSLRGGEISGAMISKAIYICSGLLTASLGFLKKKK